MVSISRLQLTNFRNYQSADFNFDSDLVIIVGNNGSGKTNLLEAISLLTKGRGIRSCDLNQLVNKNFPDDDFTIFAEAQDHPELNIIATSYSKNNGKRIFRIDGKNQQKFHPTVIWLTPLMDSIFVDSRQIRRKFLDKIVADIDPLHLSRINSYDLALRERMNLLEKFGQKENSNQWLEIIERKISELGVAIAIARNEVISYLNKLVIAFDTDFIKTKINIIGDVEQWSISKKSIKVEENFFEKLKENRKLDLKLGKTSFGVHRSDFTATLLDKNIEAKFCSTGEQKLILIALTFLRVKIFSLLDLPMPILLLDEIVSHLDLSKREALFKELKQLKVQSFLTGTEREIFLNLEFFKNCQKNNSKMMQFLDLT
jgi:DNA replication and repair protein RecF